MSTVVVHAPAVLLRAADTGVVVDLDVVHRIAVDHRRTLLAEEPLEDKRISGVAADEAVGAEFDDITQPRLRVFDLR